MPKDDGMGEKTEPATQKRREEAREKGQVAKSQDLTGALVMLLGFASLKVLGTWLGPQILAYFRWPFANLDGYELGMETHISGWSSGIGGLLLIMSPLLGVLFVVAAAVTVMQVGFHFAPKAFELDINKMNPIKGFQKLFSVRSLTKLVLGLAKTAVLGLMLWMFMASEMDWMMGMMSFFDGTSKNAANVTLYLLDAVIWLGIYAGATLTIIGIIDFSYQKWQHDEDLKMSKQEVKEEMKNMDGDPMIKRKRMERARKVAMGRMMKAVPEADVVVTNPTHYSVAIRYIDKERAPRVVAKGQDLLALKIREIASEHRVPIVERPELARALYRYAEIDEFVPEEHWGTVAEVLAYVYSIDKRRKNRALNTPVGAN
jgi:flagellar biosynthetic protein FlhB